MRSFSVVLALLVSFLTTTAQVPKQEDTYALLRKNAESEYAQKSYARAHELYEQAAKLTLDAEQRRWVNLRLADTQWRNENANPSADPTKRDEARAALETVVRESGENHDRIWAEANEALGDFFLLQPGYPDTGNALQYYTQALDWWGGSADLDLARARYLGIVFRIDDVTRNQRYGEWFVLPRPVLVNAVSIAKTPQDRARTRFLLASEMLRYNNRADRDRALELLDDVIALKRATEWYDDALFLSAQRLEQSFVIDGDNRIVSKPQFERALEFYRRLVAEFTPGESRYVEQARTAIRNITTPTVSVMTAGTFVPGSEQEVIVASRNVADVELTIEPTTLSGRTVDFSRPNAFQSLKPSGRSVRRWTVKATQLGPYVPVSDRIRLDPKLGRGAWLVTAKGAGVSATQLLLVTDLNLTVHSSGKTVAVFACDAITGAPVNDAEVTCSIPSPNGGQPPTQYTARTSSDGRATFEPFANDIRHYGNITITARARDAEAYVQTWSYSSYGGPNEQWRIYAFTDRPAYRPDETVRWKAIARLRGTDEQWITPAGRELGYEITNPRGEKIASGTAKLNEFGSFWGELPLTASMPLGTYQIRFTYRDAQSRTQYAANASLFRLEEYKLPEFAVSVKTDDRVYRLGETVTANIEASYYFGGPVANATVEAVVYRQPFVHYWAGWREYPWYWQTPASGYPEEMKRETLKTDENGRAQITIETNPDEPDIQFRIEARVTDASRREVAGSGSVRVTRTRYSVVAHPQHYVYRPGDRVVVDFKALDANDRPVRTKGRITVVRRQWQEVWIDPQGREVSGRALERLRNSSRVFPPEAEWVRKSARYVDESVTEATVDTDAEGNATVTFDAAKIGYYTVRWSSHDPEGSTAARDEITTEASIFVSDGSAVDLGYNATGIQLIADRDSFRSGRKATVLLITPAPGRWVFVSTSGSEMIDSQVVRVDGTSRVLELDVDSRHVPSFCVTASSVYDRALSTVSQQLIVPPAEHFLKIDVASDKGEYRPREEGTVTVTARDADGKPVRAEVALAVSDEAVTAIQKDLAGDPREFFFGQLRGCNLTATASVATQRYVSLTEYEGKLVDERYARERRASDERQRDEERDQSLGIPPPPPAPMPAPQGVSESITVTQEARVNADAVASMPAARSVMKAEGGTVGNVAGGMDVQVRSDFSSTAFWQPDVVTGADGTARVKVRFPDSLTTWTMTARGVTTAMQVGSGAASAKTSMPLLVRLQSPRFFVEGDRAVVSAVINNNTASPMRVTPRLDATGVVLDTPADASAVEVPAHGEARADWTITARERGPAKLRVTATAGELGDSMEKPFTVHEHGVDKLVARSGKLRGSEAVIAMALPHERRATSFVVDVQPSLAVTMLDALPYLIEFPYGCTEQTMSRFLPAAIVARTLAANGLDPHQIEGRIFGGVEASSAASTHSVAAEPLSRIRTVTRASMARLYDFQHGDGGWGWWKEDSSDDWMTAYVVWGFSIAKAGGLDVDENAVNRAASHLDQRLVHNENEVNNRIWMLRAIGAWKAANPQQGLTENQRRAFDAAFQSRERATAYGRALLALAAHDFGDRERAAILVRNLEDGVRVDRAPDKSILLRGSGQNAAETMATAHWGEDRGWWRWFDGGVESTSFALQALVAIDPANKLIEPAMNWLVKNRRGAQWSNTRDTAIALLGLTDYLRASGELTSTTSYEVVVNGKTLGRREVTPKNVLTSAARFEVDEELTRDDNEVRITRTGGTGPLYFATYARFVSREEPVKAAGNELFVRRDYFRMVPRPTLLKGVVYDRQPLLDLQEVVSGERVEVVVTIETKNDYEYLMFEDLKPAGLEATALQSGSTWATELRSSAAERKFAGGNPPAERPTVVQRARSADTTYRNAWVYQELRDRKVAMFISHLPQGIWEIRYTLRAEVPGTFHALPLLGQAMYVPEIRANSDELRITVKDAQR